MARAHMPRSEIRRLLQKGHIVTVPRPQARRGVATAPSRADVAEPVPAPKPPHHRVMAERFGLEPSPNERTYVGARIIVERYATPVAKVLVIETNDAVRELDGDGEGLDWGHRGHAARALSRAILRDACGPEFAEQNFDAYTRDVVSSLTADHFVLRLSEIAAWGAVREAGLT